MPQACPQTGTTQDENILNQTFVLHVPGPLANQLISAGPAEDRYYGSSTLLHTLEDHDPATGSAIRHDNRILRFGGTTKTPLGFFDTLASVEEWDWAASPAPAWITKTPLVHKRASQNAVLLPTGKILVVGGSKNAYHHGAGAALHEPIAELYDPGTTPQSAGSTTLMAGQTVGRMYHSFALLLPDGRVLSAGGQGSGTPDNGDVLSPPYMFQPRPRIETAPATITPGSTFGLTVIEASRGATIYEFSVALLRAGSVTHAFDFDQRYVELTFVASPSGEDSRFTLTVNSPIDHTYTPPGYYMLFVIQNGIPSTASIV